MPTLFINGTIDKHFLPPMWGPSTDLPAGPTHRSLLIDFQHSQTAGCQPDEIAYFINQHCKNGPTFPRCLDSQHDDKLSHATFSAVETDDVVDYIYTCDTGPWPERTWRSHPVQLTHNRATADRPKGSTAAFIRLTTATGLQSNGTIWIQPSERII